MRLKLAHAGSESRSHVSLLSAQTYILNGNNITFDEILGM